MGGVVDAVAPRLVRGRRRDRPLPAVVSVADVGRLVRAAGSVRNQTMIERLYSTGCRVGELVRIRVENVDTSRRTIQVTGKGKQRTVFFGCCAARLVRRHLRGRRKGPLFVPELLRQTGCIHADKGVWRLHWRDYSGGTVHAHKTSTYLGINLTLRQAKLRAQQLVPKSKLIGPPQHRHLQTQAVTRVLRYAALRAGLARTTPHMIRHSFATHLLQNGCRHSSHSRFTGTHVSHHDSDIYARREYRTGEGPSSLSPKEIACLDRAQNFHSLRNLDVDPNEPETRTYFCNRGTCPSRFHCKCGRSCRASISPRCGITLTTTAA